MSLGIPLPTLHYSRIPLERRALVSIYTLSLDLDELFIGYSFCWTSESLFKASISLLCPWIPTWSTSWLYPNTYNSSRDQQDPNGLSCSRSYLESCRTSGLVRNMASGRVCRHPTAVSVTRSLVPSVGAPVCSSLTSWRVQGPGWFCLWALDLVEVRGGRACGETLFSSGCSVSLVVHAEGCFHNVFDSAGSAGVAFGPTLVVGRGITLFCYFVVLCSRSVGGGMTFGVPGGGVREIFQLSDRWFGSQTETYIHPSLKPSEASLNC
ncbi:hypothetical protein Taro_040754 [Colocasia esculenta]|uniref:Uncharacterized protein n=1 Tax=Colocasia esculenta TaxID=4460 RepID=A0A843WJT9_COLES|nr:hypothetical protein [Colocasia esculenta]